MRCDNIIDCKHVECRHEKLTYEEWEQLFSWFPLWVGYGALLSSIATRYLYDMSKNKNKMSVWYAIHHFDEFTSEKDIWFRYRFKGDFEAWQEDHEVYRLDNGNYLVHI